MRFTKHLLASFLLLFSSNIFAAHPSIHYSMINGEL